MQHTLPILGMACASCAANVEKHLNAMPGIASAAVSLPTRSAFIDFDPDRVSLQDIKQHINQLGYDAVIEAETSVDELERRALRGLERRTLLAWALSAAVMAVSMGWIPLPSTTWANGLAMLLALVVMVICGGGIYRSAARQLRHATANMDSLIALSTLIAFGFSAFNTLWGESVWGARGIVWHTYFDASAMIIAFVLTGRWLEEKARGGTAASIRQLMGLAPKMARRVVGDTIEEMPIAAIAVGDVLEVGAGQRVPVDGQVVSAESFMTPDAAYVDESMITGEPTPVAKRTGDRVLAGTIPNQGSLRMVAEAVGESTALAHIVRMVQAAQGSKAPVQRIVDRAASIFVPTIAAIAALTFGVWWFVGGTAALPQAILSAVAVLVVACPCAMGLATPTALMVGIGRAAERQILIKDATALEALRKVDALVTDKTGTLTIPNRDVDFTRSEGLGFEQRETLKPHAREAIAQLQTAGIEVHLMSGDHDEAAHFWAQRVGIAHYHSGALPADKEALVRQLQAEGKAVAMMGDGINDTQALALADVSIAIGRGTDVAMDVAQVTLMGDDLNALPEALRLSRQTVSMIRQNLFWAFIYNLVCIPLAAGLPHAFGWDFHITPMLASALMALSSVSVVANSLRLRWK